MDRPNFESWMRAARELSRLSDHASSDYWAGYQRGLRRAFHSEAFGSSTEHGKWSELDDLRGVGYRAGFRETPIECAISQSDLYTAQACFSLTNREMADRLGVTERTIEHYRQGARQIRGAAAVLIRQMVALK